MLNSVYQAALACPKRKVICAYIPGFISQENYIFKRDKAEELTRTAHVEIDGKLGHYHWTQSGFVPGNYSLRDACVALLGEGPWINLPFHASLFDEEDILFSGFDQDMPDDLRDRLQKSNSSVLERIISPHGHFNFVLENSFPFRTRASEWNFPSA